MPINRKRNARPALNNSDLICPATAPREHNTLSADFARMQFDPDPPPGDPLDDSVPLPIPLRYRRDGSPDSYAPVRGSDPSEHDIASPPRTPMRPAGHVRSAVLARQPTPLESFSRTLRNYVPSSIPIPSAAPTPPRVSRPISYASFLTPAPPARVLASDGGKRRGSDAHSPASPGARPAWDSQVPADEAAFTISEDDTDERPQAVVQYPGTDDSEAITWAGWSELFTDHGCQPRRILTLGYPSGLQIWDCTDLRSISEVLNLKGSQWGCVRHIAALPSPVSLQGDHFSQERPLIGILSYNSNHASFIVYSLRSHKTITSISLPGLHSFSAVANLIILSTLDPPTLLILSSRTLVTLATIPSSSLLSFAHTSTYNKDNNNNNNNNNVLSLDLDGPTSHLSHLSPLPRPIFALSPRLIAFASPAPRNEYPIPPLSTQPRTTPPIDGAKLAFGMSQADISNAAVKIGGNVLSGMRSLGGMAFSAAKAGVTAAVGEVRAPARRNTGPSTMSGMFFSRSAPAASGRESEHRYSSSTSDAERLRDKLSAPDGNTSPTFFPESSREASPAAGYYVTVLDLSSFQDTPSPAPAVKIAEFQISKHQPVSNIKFSSDGSSLFVSMKDGQVARVYQLKPMPRVLREIHDSKLANENDSRSKNMAQAEGSKPPPEAPWHLYSLHRGRTSAIVDNVDWAQDGRWIAVGTRKRTIHMFALNPYGGPPDEASHLDGRVRNCAQSQVLSVVVHPISRLRALKTPPLEQRCPPLAFTLLRSSEFMLPASLLPPAAVKYSSSPSLSGAHSALHRSKPALPLQREAHQANFQDTLVFDPFDGTLTLRRISLERSATEQGILAGKSVPAFGGTSISLPGVSTIGRFAPTAVSPDKPRKSGLSTMMEKPIGLVARESVVATWNLRRGHRWTEVRQELRPGQAQERRSRLAKSEWLSQAELSTNSHLPLGQPRSIYLSHQFSFHTFGEDYHALIRSHHIDIPATKIEVRREVAISAYSTGLGESFVQSASVPGEIGAPSSFDEPLASALAGEIPHVESSPPVLPMLPNGAPGSLSRSLRNTAPIRNVAAGISDGMSGGFGRLRREIGKVRSPRLPASSVHNAATLEFDEEDEDFLAADVTDTTNSEDNIPSSPPQWGGSNRLETLLSSPSTNIEPLPVEDEGDGMWQGWDLDDRQAIDDAENFHDISAVGFMDEEQASMMEAERKRSRRRIARRY